MTIVNGLPNDPDKHFSCFLELSSRKHFVILHRHSNQQNRGQRGHDLRSLHKISGFYLGQDNYVYARVMAIDSSVDFYNYVQLGKITETSTNNEAKGA